MERILTIKHNPEGVELRNTLVQQVRSFKQPKTLFMSSYKQIFYHIIFSTKHREATMPEVHHHELYNYIFGIIKKQSCKLYRINSTEDHLHIFSDLHPSISLSNYVKDIKLASGDWMKSSGHFPNFTHWQNGYAAITNSVNEKDRIYEYVKNQKEHHKTETFLDEYKHILQENGIVFDERYLL